MRPIISRTLCGLVLGLSLATAARADVSLYNFEAYADTALLGDGAVLDPGEVLTTFGFPIGNQAPPLETAVRATTVTPITLGGGSVSARFTADWNLDAASPYFAGVLLANSQTNLTTFSDGQVDLRSTGAGTTSIAMLINDGTNSYEHTSTSILSGDNTYTFDFTTPGNWTRTTSDPSVSYTDVLSNAQFIGFTLSRAAFSTDVETIHFDNVELVPEPSTILLMALGWMTLTMNPQATRPGWLRWPHGLLRQG